MLFRSPALWPPSPSTWLPPSGSSVLLGLCCCLQQVGWDCSQSGDQLISLSRCLRAPQKGSLRRTWLICLESFRDPGPDWRKLLSSPRPGERAGRFTAAALLQGSPRSRHCLPGPPGGQMTTARVRVRLGPMVRTKRPRGGMTEPIRPDTCLSALLFPTVNLPQFHSQVSSRATHALSV